MEPRRWEWSRGSKRSLGRLFPDRWVWNNGSEWHGGIGHRYANCLRRLRYLQRLDSNQVLEKAVWHDRQYFGRNVLEFREFLCRSSGWGWQSHQAWKPRSLVLREVWQRDERHWNCLWSADRGWRQRITHTRAAACCDWGFRRLWSDGLWPIWVFEWLGVTRAKRWRCLTRGAESVSTAIDVLRGWNSHPGAAMCRALGLQCRKHRYREHQKQRTETFPWLLLCVSGSKLCRESGSSKRCFRWRWIYRVLQRLQYKHLLFSDCRYALLYGSGWWSAYPRGSEKWCWRVWDYC